VTTAEPQLSEQPDESERDPLLGTMIGERYRLEAVLGTGGMGTVYLAEHVLMEKKVALKVLHPTLAVVGSVMERFQHEAVALCRINHPNVVDATDFGKLPNGAYYLALQYVEGADLAHILARDGAFGAARAAAIALQIARALAAAHAEGVIHRDLKPHNIMLTRNAQGEELAKVLDFGLAKLRSKTGDEPSINTGSVFGTPHYISPEQLSGARVDGRSDLYSLGVILYEMCSGLRPFDGKDIRDVLRRQVTEAPAPLPETIPLGLRQLVIQLTQKDPAGRPDSADVVAATLEQLLAPPRETLLPAWLMHPLHLGRVEVPTWIVVLPGIVFVGIFVLGLVWSGTSTPSPVAGTVTTATSVQASPPAFKPPPEPDAKLQLMSRAEFGDAKAMDALLKIPPTERSAEEWLVLGEGYMQSRQLQQALELYRNAIAHVPTLAENERISESVRTAAKDGAFATAAVGLAAESMGERGVNILFSVWADTARRSPASALAQRYLDEDKVIKKASPAVRLALALREQHTCDDTRKLLQDAAQFGDTRSLRPMAKLRALKGCGSDRSQDCYPCLRKDTLLEDAIAAAAKRIAPKG
jgi:eukaryotic-like serine/threonine-protein kinase